MFDNLRIALDAREEGLARARNIEVSALNEWRESCRPWFEAAHEVFGEVRPTDQEAHELFELLPVHYLERFVEWVVKHFSDGYKSIALVIYSGTADTFGCSDLDDALLKFRSLRDRWSGFLTVRVERIHDPQCVSVVITA